MYGKLECTVDQIFYVFLLIKAVPDKVNVFMFSLSNLECKSLNGLLEISSTAFHLRPLLFFCGFKVFFKWFIVFVIIKTTNNCVGIIDFQIAIAFT